MEAPAALVTGASRGIGRAVCELLVERGRRVVACARDAAALAQLEARYPGQLQGLTADLSSPAEGQRLVDAAERAFGPLRELVLCAGIVRYAGVGQISEQDLRDQLELNFVVPFLMTQQVGTRMRARGRGAIVHVASTLGQRPAPQTAAYAASKAALLSATRSFAVELAPQVRVNAVAPGVVDTDMIRAPRAAEGAAEPQALSRRLQALASLHPLGRLGTPEEVAGAVLFLLEAVWATGTVLTLDGGLTAA